MTPLTVLLVEDNANDEALTLRAFKKNNIPNPVVVVRDGIEALDYLFCTGLYENRNPEEQPALILLDIKIPKIDGLEVLRRLRADARTRFIPVTVLTSSIENQDLAVAYSLGANSYIRKPVDFSAFRDAIELLCRYWLGLNQLSTSGTSKP